MKRDSNRWSSGVFLISTAMIWLLGTIDAHAESRFTATIEAVTKSPTNGNVVVFAIRFSEPVTEFDAADLLVVKSGALSGEVHVAGFGDTYRVTVEDVVGDGSVSISLDSGGEFSGVSGRVKASGMVSESVEVDQTPPTLESLLPSTLYSVGQDMVLYHAIFSEPVTGLRSLSDFNIEHEGTTSVGVYVDGDGAEYDISVFGIEGMGGFLLSISAESDIADLAGNLLTGDLLGGHHARRHAAGINLTPAVRLGTDLPVDTTTNRYGPEVLSDGAGHWVAVWSSLYNPDEAFGSDTDIFVSVSSDNAITWSAPALLNSTGTIDGGAADFAPYLVYDDGVWLILWRSRYNLNGKGSDSDILFARSVDNGLSWSEPGFLNTNAASDGGAIDFGPRLAGDGNGKWMAVWHSSARIGESGPDHDILVSHSEDNGLTWSSPSFVNSNAADDEGDLDADIATDGVGNWVIVWSSLTRPNGSVSGDWDLVYQRSIDDGTTWSEVQYLESGSATDSNNETDPHLVLDDSGNWLVIWTSESVNKGAFGNNTHVMVSRSSDAAFTWNAPVSVSGAADFIPQSSFKLPHLATDKSGRWIAIWTAQISPSTVEKVVLAQSDDVGSTWSGELPIFGLPESDTNTKDPSRITTDGAGTWVGAWRAGSEVYLRRFTLDGKGQCPETSVYAQEPTTSDRFNREFVSDIERGTVLYDSFNAHRSWANGIRWWGTFEGEACSSENGSYVVAFYPRIFGPFHSGGPETIEVVPTVTPLGIVDASDRPVYQFDASFPRSLVVNSGWIAIASQDAECPLVPGLSIEGWPGSYWFNGHRLEYHLLSMAFCLSFEADIGTDGEFPEEGEGEHEGVIEGDPVPEGEVDGDFEGEEEVEGARDIPLWVSLSDIARDILGRFASLDMDEDGYLSIAELSAYLSGWKSLEFPVESVFEALGSNDDGKISIGELRAFNDESPVHASDENGNSEIELSELLRVIQLYNGGSFGCDLGSTDAKDGYSMVSDAIGCVPHSADYNPQDWSLSLSELLRVVQIYSMRAYAYCSGLSEDNYCAILK